jgi:lysophospholipase L1-like esterase
LSRGGLPAAPALSALGQGRPRESSQQVQGDFDGDGKTDLAVYRPSTAQWLIFPSTAGPRVVPLGVPDQDVPVPADYDGDGQADPAVYQPATALWLISPSSSAERAVQFGAPGDIPVPGDYDGDGKADLAVFRPSTAQWLIWQSSAGPRAVQFGAPGDIPVPADYDGDGKTDVAVYRPATAQWFLWQSSAGAKAVQFGGPDQDVPVPADYDGDGRADLAVYRPVTAQWFLWQSSAGLRAVQFGAPGVDVPVAGDYDGDGEADLAVYRPTTAQWLVFQSAAGPRSVQFGAPEQIPYGGLETDVPPLVPLAERPTPLAAIATTPHPRSDPYAVLRHEQDVARAATGRDQVVFFGDSITELWGDSGRDLGPATAVWDQEIAPFGAANFGVIGDQTQDLLWRLEGGELAGRPKVAVVLIGTNDTSSLSPDQTAAGIAAVVRTIRQLSPTTKVLLMGLFPRRDEPTATIARVNALISGLDNGTTVRYLDIGAQFLAPDGSLPVALFPDGLHPSPAAYRIWADAIQGLLRQMLQ